MNMITIELCKEDRARLDSILEALQGKDVSLPIYKEEEKVPPAAPEAVHTAEDVRRLFVRLTASGHRDAASDIIKQHAAKISDIPEDKVSEVWQQLTALETA